MRYRLVGHVLRSPPTVAAICATALLLAGCGTESANRRPTESRSAPAPAARDWRALAVFRRLQRPSDLIARRAVPRAYVRLYRAQPAEARLAFRGPRSRVHLIPANGRLCLVGKQSRTTNCWPPSTVLSGNAIGATVCAPGLPTGIIEIAGIVPDDVRRVGIVRADGTRRPMALGSNVFVGELLRADPPPVRVEMLRDGRWSTHLPGVLPRDLKAGCGSGLAD